MTGTNLKSALPDIDMSVAGLRSAIMQLSGQKIAEATVYQWTSGTRKLSPSAAAQVALLARLPALNRAALNSRYGRSICPATGD